MKFKKLTAIFEKNFGNSGKITWTLTNDTGIPGHLLMTITDRRNVDGLRMTHAIGLNLSEVFIKGVETHIDQYGKFPEQTEDVDNEEETEPLPDTEDGWETWKSPWKDGDGTLRKDRRPTSTVYPSITGDTYVAYKMRDDSGYSNKNDEGYVDQVKHLMWDLADDSPFAITSFKVLKDAEIPYNDWEPTKEQVLISKSYPPEEFHPVSVFKTDRVDLIFRNGAKKKNTKVENWDWTQYSADFSSQFDIIKYRRAANNPV